MSLHDRSQQSNKFDVFMNLFVDFNSDNTVLDFGGNRGNLLYFSNGKIRPHNYTSLDVDSSALAVGKQEFPTATWLHYNKFNFMYNHNGHLNEPYPTIKSTDYIWAYSVFTHTDLDELKNAIFWFYTVKCKNAAISILDINNKQVTDYFYQKRVEHYGSCVDLTEYQSCNIVYLENNHKITVNQECLSPKPMNHFASFYNIKWLKSELQKINSNIDIVYLTNNFSPFIILN